jgi:peptidoglycan/xylan/chitin deacetylase (PgdA/CDA1 family)
MFFLTNRASPEQCKMVAEKGHEIGLHGYSHENPIAMTLEQQTVVMDKVF